MAKTIKEMIEVMEWFEGGGAIECAEKGYDDWEININPLWDWNNFEYRTKEFQYPMWFKDNYKGSVIKFDSLESGTVVETGTSPYKKGEYRQCWIEHTNSDVWTEIEEPKEKVRIEKWLMSRGEEYYILNTSKIDNYDLSTPVKLLETYEIEI